MRFSFTPEQEEFRTSLRRALEARSPTKEVRRLMATETGFERESWRKLNQELGLTALHIPEAYGGGGFGYAELAIVLEEAGRGLLCAPFFSTVLATTAILNAGTEEQKQALLPAIADGTTTATLAFSEDDGRNDAAGTTTEANHSGGTYRLDGIKNFVLDGQTADLIVVLARRPGSSGEQGLSFFTVSGDTPGLERRLLKTMDETRKLARLEFNAVEARLLGEVGGGGRALRPHHAAGCRPARQRNGGRRRAAARGCAGLHQDAHAVRPRHRLLPDDQEQGGRHAGRCRAGEVGGLLRGRGAR